MNLYYTQGKASISLMDSDHQRKQKEAHIVYLRYIEGFANISLPQLQPHFTNATNTLEEIHFQVKSFSFPSTTPNILATDKIELSVGFLIHENGISEYGLIGGWYYDVDYYTTTGDFITNAVFDNFGYSDIELSSTPGQNVLMTASQIVERINQVIHIRCHDNKIQFDAGVGFTYNYFYKATYTVFANLEFGVGVDGKMNLTWFNHNNLSTMYPYFDVVPPEGGDPNIIQTPLQLAANPWFSSIRVRVSPSRTMSAKDQFRVARYLGLTDPVGLYYNYPLVYGYTPFYKWETLFSFQEGRLLYDKANSDFAMGDYAPTRVTHYAPSVMNVARFTDLRITITANGNMYDYTGARLYALEYVKMTYDYAHAQIEVALPNNRTYQLRDSLQSMKNMVIQVFDDSDDFHRTDMVKFKEHWQLKLAMFFKD